VVILRSHGHASIHRLYVCYTVSLSGCLSVSVSVCVCAEVTRPHAVVIIAVVIRITLITLSCHCTIISSSSRNRHRAHIMSTVITSYTDALVSAADRQTDRRRPWQNVEWFSNADIRSPAHPVDIVNESQASIAGWHGDGDCQSSRCETRHSYTHSTVCHLSQADTVLITFLTALAVIAPQRDNITIGTLHAHDAPVGCYALCAARRALRGWTPNTHHSSTHIGCRGCRPLWSPVKDSCLTSHSRRNPHRLPIFQQLLERHWQIRLQKTGSVVCRHKVNSDISVFETRREAWTSS